MHRELIISSSGLRAKYGPEEIRNLFFGLGWALPSKFEGDFVAGIDTRPTSLPAVESLMAGLEAAGGKVDFVGICPVSAVSHLVSEGMARSGLLVTASHNPVEWNGLKVFGRDGIIVAKETIEAIFQDASNVPITPYARLVTAKETWVKDYVSSVIDELRRLGVSADNLRIVVDVGNGSLSRISKDFLEALGANVKILNAEIDGRFRRPIEPLPENLGRLRDEVVKQKADFGIAHDADGDRAVLVDERGKVLREDATLAAGLMTLLERVRSPLVVNFASSSLFEILASDKGVPLFYSEVGERNLVMRMKEVGSIVGGEGSCGGVVYTKLSHTRDGLLASGLVAGLIREKGPLSKALSKYLNFFVSKATFNYRPTSIEFSKLVQSLKQEMPQVKHVEMGDIKFIEEGGWVLIRASKTQSIIRVVAEARDQRSADTLLRKYAPIVKKKLASAHSENSL